MYPHWKLLAIPLLLAAGCTNPGPPRELTDSGTDASIVDMGDETADTGANVMPGPDMEIPEEDMGPGDMGATDMGPTDMGEPADMAPANFDETGRSGTRLRRMYLDAGGGAAQTFSFYDTLLDVPCQFREARDGAIRCLPDDRILSPLRFSDSGCTQPVHEVTENWCSTMWAEDRYTNELYRATDTPAVLTNNTTYGKATTGECVASVTTGENDFFVAELVTAADFVEGVPSDEPRSPNMVARFLEGEDGSRTLHKVIHATRGYECDFSRTGHCLPSTSELRINSYAFNDSGCTQPLYGFRDEPAPMIVLSTRDANGCVTSTDYFETGIQEMGNIYEMQGGTCVQLNSPTDKYHYAGLRIQLSDLPKPREVQVGSGELVALRYEDDDRVPLGRPHAFYDTTTDEPCEARETEDGEAVCLPTNVAESNAFAFPDDTCMDAFGLGTKVCDTTPPAVVADWTSNNCEIPTLFGVTSAREGGAATGSSDYYFSNGGPTCTPATLPSTEFAFESGASVLDTLPRFDVLTE